MFVWLIIITKVSHGLQEVSSCLIKQSKEFSKNYNVLVFKFVYRTELEYKNCISLLKLIQSENIKDE